MGGDYPDRDPQLFYELARDRHAGQAALVDSLDSKLGLVLSGSSALIAILVAVYALRPDAFNGLELILVAASAGAWLSLTGVALHGLWHRGWRGGPQLQRVFDLYFSEDERKLKWRVANVYWHDYSANRHHVDRKDKALTWVLRLVVIQTGLLVAALCLVAATGTGSSTRSECPVRAAHGERAVLRQEIPRQEVSDPGREDQTGFDPAPRSSRGSLTGPYAARGTALARPSACPSRASITRSA